MQQPSPRVLLDFGAVITAPQDASVYDPLLGELGLSREAFFAAWAARRLEWDAGSLDGEGYWALTLEAAGVPWAGRIARERVDELIDLDFRAFLRYREGFRRLIEDLLGRGVGLGILSNMPPGQGARFVEAWPWLGAIPHRLFSGDEGLVKPQAAIFQLFLERSGWRPEETLFVDDAPANVAAAARLGFAVHHFREEAEALAAVEAWTRPA